MPIQNKPMVQKARKRGRPAGSSRSASLEQILSAARLLFATQGYTRTTVREIAMAVGMTSAALYTYFPSKAVLYKATCDHAQGQLLKEYREAIGKSGNLRAQLGNILQVAVSAHQHDSSITALLAGIPMEAGRDKELGALMLDQQNATRLLLTELFREAQKRGEVSVQADPAAQAMTLVGAIAGIALLPDHTREQDLASSLNIFTELINGQLFTDI